MVLVMEGSAGRRLLLLHMDFRLFLWHGMAMVAEGVLGMRPRSSI